MKILDRAKELIRTDVNINRFRGFGGKVFPKLPYATAEYLLEKLPILQWLPRYDIRWLITDAIAGITIGVMFIPQGLAYAKIATIPVEHGLYSCWLPSALYLFMGTSKELSTGPTSILGLLTADVVADLTKEGYSPAQIAAAIAMMAGVYNLLIGVLKLGFLLDFVSLPVLTGWISAVAIVILMGQIDNLIGMDVGRGTATIIREILTQLHTIQPYTLAIGFTGIALLVGLQEVGKRWGKKSIYIKFLSTSRAVVVLFIYTLISYLVNKDRPEDDPLWSITKVETDGLPTPKPPDTTLLGKVAARAFAPFIACAVEHLGVGKAFGLRNGYVIDKSQELVFLGVENIFNSFFGAMTTGAAMSRTAVNSECGVRSPVNFAFTSGFIILTLYELAPALYWIPKATLSAIIIMAVVHLIGPMNLFWRYWRMSFIDWTASMLGFWVTLFVSTEIGLAVAVGFSIVHTLIRLAFPGLFLLSAGERQSGSDGSGNEKRDVHVEKRGPFASGNEANVEVPIDAFLVRYKEDLLYPNAERIKSSVVDAVRLHFEAASSGSQERTWDVASARRMERKRRREGIQVLPHEEAPLRVVVLDFTLVQFIDVTGVTSIGEMKVELRRHAGADLQFRFVGLVDGVRERFRRGGWIFAGHREERFGEGDVEYASVEMALWYREESDDMAEKDATLAEVRAVE